MRKFGIVLLLLFIVGCSFQKEKSQEKEKSNYNPSEKSYIPVVLSINMPLQYDDLDQIFEFPMMDYLEKNDIGEITGDGFPVDEFGPYATDIEFYINSSKLDQFRKMLAIYEFPKGSYLNIEEKKEELAGNILGIRLQFSNLNSTDIINLYSELSVFLQDFYTYKTIIELEDNKLVYYYGKNRNDMKKKIEEFLAKKELVEKVKIIDMPMTIKEIGKRK